MVTGMGRNDTPGDDPLDELGRELRERMGSEMRMEAELSEQDAAVVELRRRTLSEVAGELASRGDTVSVFAGDRSVRGVITYARGDLATLETTHGDLDVHLTSGVAMRVDVRSTAGGTAPRSGSDTLRARLLEYELAGSQIEMWIPRHGLEIAGVLSVVGKDHATVIDQADQEWTVSLSDIAWVRRTR